MTHVFLTDQVRPDNEQAKLLEKWINSQKDITSQSGSSPYVKMKDKKEHADESDNLSAEENDVLSENSDMVSEESDKDLFNESSTNIFCCYLNF